MFKRILVLGAGMLLGVALALAGLRLATAWGLFPSRDLSRSSTYVREVMRLVQENYVDEKAVAYDSLARNAIHGLVESLDPHSEFLEEKDNLEFEEDLTGEFGGVGLQVETRQNRVVVIAPLAGTPGERAGIQRGDEIVTIDGKSVETNASMDSVVSRLRGQPKTRVTVGLFRPGTRETLSYTLVREVIRIESVRDVKIIGDGVGYIQLTEFSEHTAEQFDQALDRLLREGATSLILDLRNNPGGLLDAAVEVAEPFFKRGELIVSTKGRKRSDHEEYRAELDGDPVDVPVVVLINAGSASAAEVVTGALKDTGRAVVIGERSFGKGSVQSIFKLENGEGLRLTTGRYFTPAGVSIHERGIAPHVEVVMTPEEDNKLARQRSRPDITDPQEFKARFGFEPIADRQLDTALAVLKAHRLLEARPARTLAARRLP
ncbi:S41 family peptidase [Opitutus sp. ER46]|uniref:S41 family peptidase n=1 Tax=Opitutus sp. ER46 TaxID=2161864 RepID=UPI000D2FBD4C|nr:S41 family peptidase [Opitutus sp. ER46]PTX92639.1 S41 family peptidase [Opitutus sp. ER46]